LNDKLVGGLYGVVVGKVFCGESMFAYETDASKAAYAPQMYLYKILATTRGFKGITKKVIHFIIHFTMVQNLIYICIIHLICVDLQTNSPLLLLHKLSFHPLLFDDMVMDQLI